MRKPIIAGNWKMNKTASEALAFAEAVKTKIPANNVCSFQKILNIKAKLK